MASRLIEPTARFWHAAVGDGDKMFVWTGYGDFPEVQTTTVESFNVRSLAWEKPQQLKGSLPDCLRDAAVTSDGGSAYSVGGRTSSGLINTVYKINPRTLTCMELQPNGLSFPPQKQVCSRSVCFQRKLVVYGGGADSDKLYVFDLDKSEYENIKLYSCIG